MAEPEARFYESQGLRLHYADWGNAAAPPLVLIHGGLDHCRNWDAIARALRPHFHIVAPDLRGHGDSEWAKGSSYTLTDNVVDLTRLIAVAELKDAAIIGHSMGGMVAQAYAGTFPTRVSRLAVLDGTFLSYANPVPIDERMSRWNKQLERIAQHEPSAFKTIELLRLVAEIPAQQPVRALLLQLLQIVAGALQPYAQRQRFVVVAAVHRRLGMGCPRA